MNWESWGIEFLGASLVRPFGLAVVAWLMLRLLRVRHPASRHAVWTAVLIGILLLPVLSVVAPHWKVPVLPRKHDGAAVVGLAPGGSESGGSVTGGFEVGSVDSGVREAGDRPGGLPYIYLVGLLAVVTYQLAGWVLLRRLVLRSRLLRGRLRESNDVVTPVAVGVWRPVVILPGGWRGWTADTKRAVLAHEFAHLRRHDTLVSALARVAQCVFWFHPLAWWLSRKIAELAELACDAAVLERVDDPAGYSRILLEFADAVNRAGRRVALPGLAMAAGSGMDRRIDGVFELSSGTMRKLSRPGVLLALMGLPVMCLAAIFEPAPVQRPAAPQPAPAPAAKFEVASVKPCKEADTLQGGRGASGGRSSPVRLRIDCQTVKDLIQSAYLRYANGEGHSPWVIASTRIEGGPAWINSERYMIDAKPEDATAQETMRGPMMQRLLEERFQLKIHRETREAPVYELTVAKGGAKLQPAKEGCIPASIAWATAQAQPRAPGQELCRVMVMPSGGLFTLDAQSMSLGDFSKLIGLSGRPVIDKTGIAGLFDFHLVFARDESAPGGGADTVAPDPGGPSIFAALKDLGLKLEAGKGAREFLVIDSVERPSGN